MVNKLLNQGHVINHLKGLTFTILYKRCIIIITLKKVLILFLMF